MPLSIYRVHRDSGSANLFGREKIHGAVQGKEAILSEILVGPFDEDIKVLYGLKVKVMQLILKEVSGQKRFPDILDLWSYIVKNSRVFGGDIFRVIEKYWILQRTLPTPLLQLVRTLTRCRGERMMH